MTTAPFLILAAGGIMVIKDLPRLPSWKRGAATLALAVIFSGLSGPAPAFANGLAGLIFLGVALSFGAPAIRKLVA